MGITVTCVVPEILVGGGTENGLQRIIQNSGQIRMLLKEIFVGMAYALTAAVAAALIAASLIRRARTSRLAAAGVFGAALPGTHGRIAGIEVPVGSSNFYSNRSRNSLTKLRCR